MFINDKRERVIKVCRDITILSKRTIFLLHRITQTDRNVVLTESETKLNELKVLFLRVSNELQGNSYHR
ncbi:hypothetical protein HK099_000201 [Clydaea vesicula]|uniref:Uncharacterized protein n=1 Tax=Clydaea vesicula TaxID=447962 RepID=A0AAD5TUX4_9FUNG|nr:hypothetical protein HK099_000201 [Clydaea vesicula]